MPTPAENAALLMGHSPILPVGAAGTNGNVAEVEYS
jgi:hypothetical protein